MVFLPTVNWGAMHSITKVAARCQKRQPQNPYLSISILTHLFSESKIDLESENIITTENAVEKDSAPSTTTTSQYIMGTEEPISEQGASLSATRPTRYMMEIDDCLPEYCMDCPLWKPFSSRRFCWLKFRCRVRVLVEKKYFEWFILATVFLSSFALVRYTINFEICLHGNSCKSA